MNTPAQDIDSGTGKIVTAGKPVSHTDLEHGVSIGHTAEPEDETPPAEPKPGDIVAEKPPGLSRDDIYNKHKNARETDTNEAIADMTAEQRAHYYRSVAEAAGITDPSQDPFDGDGNIKPDWVEPGAVVAPTAQPTPAHVVPPLTAADTPPQIVTPALDAPAEMVEIIVYGMKQQIPKADIDAAGGRANYQKIVAADEKMKRASTYEASVRALDQEVSQRLEALNKTQQTPPATVLTAAPEPSPTDAPGETVDVQPYAKKLVAAMYTGDQDAANTQVAEVLTSFKDDVVRSVRVATVQQPSAPVSLPTEDAAAQQRAAQAAADRNEANQVFTTEFEDLQSPVLREATYRMVQQVAAEPIMYGRPLAEITREAGMRIRTDVFADRPPPQPKPITPVTPAIVPGAPPTDLNERMTLKKRTVVQPLIPAHKRFAEPADAGQKTESNSEYIRRMKKESRGQGV